MGKIDAIILAGGLGTRLREAVSDLPKALVPVNGRPFLDIILHFLSKSERVAKVIIAVGYMSNKVIEQYEGCNDFGIKILFSEEKELLGTGGAIKKAMKYVETDNVLVLNGDSYADVSIDGLLLVHEKKNASMTVVLKEVENTNRYGRVRLDKDERVVSFEEKNSDSGGGYINGGIYILKRKIFDKVEDNRVLSIERDLFPLFLREAVYGYICYGKFIDIGVPATYKISSEYLKEVC